MKTNKKILLSLGALATVVAPLAGVISCGSTSDTVDHSVVTILAEKTWGTETQAIVNDFKNSDEGKTIMETNGIKDILVKVKTNAFEVLDAIPVKGAGDASITDIYMAPGDRIKSMIGNGAAHAFNENTPATFATAELDGDTFTASAIAESAPGIEEGKMYSVPQAHEAMIPLRFKAAGATTPTATITNYANLWMADGFFNTVDATGKATKNLKDIVTFDAATNKIVNHGNEAAWQTFLNSGFENMLNSAGPNFGNGDAGRGVPTEVLNSDTDKAEPFVITNFIKDKAHTSYITGPWLIDSVKKQADSLNVNDDVVAGKLKTGVSYNQWAGGWSYLMNSRLTDGQVNVAEALIGQMLDSKYAKKIYDDFGKLSPTTNGQKALTTGDSYAGDDIVKAIYNAKAVERPTAAAFNNVWGAWNTTINAKADEIVAVIAAPKVDTVKEEAKKLTSAFIAAIDTANKGVNA